ncbi:MAG: 5'-nucleotidase C-terminal domain-containing protein, partial [Bacteroidota bacterium]
LSKAKRAHPVSKELHLTLDQTYEIESVTIKGNPIEANRIYYIATNDYLYNGGDKMSFFQPNELYMELDYKIRNVLLDYFREVDTVKIAKDNRFIRHVMP